MFILNSFSIGFSTPGHSIVFFLCIFSFCKAKNFYLSATECLIQRGQNETKLDVKNMRGYLLGKKKGVSLVDRRIIKKCQ